MPGYRPTCKYKYWWIIVNISEGSMSEEVFVMLPEPFQVCNCDQWWRLGEICEATFHFALEDVRQLYSQKLQALFFFLQWNQHRKFHRLPETVANDSRPFLANLGPRPMIESRTLNSKSESLPYYLSPVHYEAIQSQSICDGLKNFSTEIRGD